MSVSVLAFLTLTTPLLLGGLSLLALPLIAHWLHRRSQRTIVFPSIALLLETVAQQSQFHRLKRWLLLALRLLAVACIVVAFTRPVWQSAAADGGLSAADAAAVVLVVDIGASTGQTSGGVTELESLKSAAGTILDDLVAGVDVAGVVLADGSPRSVFPRLSANLGGLRNELSRLTPTAERADFAAAFAAAGKLLADHQGPRRLYLLTDGQRSNWRDALAPGELGQTLPAGTVVSVAPLRREVVSNVALSNPRHYPTLPLAGEPFDVSLHVSNHSEATRQVRLVCERTSGDGAGLVLGRDEQTVALTPREQRDVAFHVSALESERQFVRLTALAEDGLTIDNSAALVVATASRTPVIVLSDDDPEEAGSSAYYLLRALSPRRRGPDALRAAAPAAERTHGRRTGRGTDRGGRLSRRTGGIGGDGPVGVRAAWRWAGDLLRGRTGRSQFTGTRDVGRRRQAAPLVSRPATSEGGDGNRPASRAGTLAVPLVAGVR